MPPWRSSSSTATPSVTATTRSPWRTTTSRTSRPTCRDSTGACQVLPGERRFCCVDAPPGSTHTQDSGRCQAVAATAARRHHEAALRELHEELGLRLGEDSVLGLLDDYVTRSGYVITPVVVWGGGDVDLAPDPAEVAHAYRIGLHELCRADSPRFTTIAESDRPLVELPLGGDLIYAPTAAMLVQFRWVGIEGRADERVDGFEQPVFAWR